MDKLNPVTGRRIARIPLPGPTTSIATGASRIWTIGATDGGPSAISAVDPATLHVDTMRLSDPNAEPYDIAFAGGSAWVAFQLLDQVWRLTPTATGIQKSVLAVGGAPRFIATTGTGQLWVQQDNGAGSLTRIIVTATSATLGSTKPWPGAIFSGTGGVMWATTTDLHTVVDLLPSRIGGNACQTCNEPLVTVSGQISDVVSTPRGVFVSASGAPATSTGHTSFYSNRDLNPRRGTHPLLKPTARIAGSGDLAADGAGVVVGTGSVGLIHWVPGR
jgi:hypothetical protein